MIQLLSLLFFISFCTPVHPVSRAQLLKMLQSNSRDVARAAENINAPAASTSAGTSAPMAATEEVAITKSLEIPPLPEKPDNLTREQSLIWDRINGMRPRLQKLESFAKAAEELEDLIDGKLVGTDPSDIIAQRVELQQLLLHTMLSALTKDDVMAAKKAGTIDAEYTLKCLKAGRLMHEELFDHQWVDMDIDKGPMQQYLGTAADRYANFTDQVLSPAETEALDQFEEMSSELNRPVVTAGSGLALMAAYAALKKANVFDKSKKARDIAKALPTNVGAFSDLKDHQAAQRVYDDLFDSRDGIFINPSIAAQEQTELQRGLQDLGEQSPGEITLAGLSNTITALLYKSPDQFNAQTINEETLDRTLNPELFVVGGNIAKLHTALLQLNQLLTSNPQTLTGETEPRVRSFLYMPDAFFIQKNIETLSKQDRYALISAGTSLVATFKKHRNQLQLKDAYAENTLESLHTAFDNLSTAGGEDKENFEKMTTYLREVKVAIAKLSKQKSIMLPPTFKHAKSENGSPLEFTALFGTNDPLTSYTKSLERLVALLTQKSGDIIGNIKVHTTLLEPSDVSIAQYDITQKLRDTFDARALKLTNDYFAIRNDIRRQVTMHTGQVFTDTYTWNSTENEVLVPVAVLLKTIYQASVSFIPVAQANIFSSSDKVATMLTAMDLLTKLLNERSDVQTSMHESVMLRKAVYDVVLLPNAFFDQSDNLKAMGRYRIAEKGDGMITALLSVEEAAPRPDPEKVSALKRLSQKFADVALAEPAEQSFRDDFEAAISAVVSLTKQLGQAERHADQELHAQYTQNMIKLVAFTDTATERRLIGYCHLVRKALFDETGLRIKDIPEGLTKEGKLAVREFLKRIDANPNELNYKEDSAFRDIVEEQLRTLFEDMNADDRTAVEKLPPMASKIYHQLTATFANLGSKETFAQAALEIYQALSGDNAEDKRELVGEHEVLYTALFSTNGIFRLPEGVSIADPAYSGMDPVACSAGLQLFEYLQKNPRDLGWKDDKMVNALLKRFITFFKAALKGKPKEVVTMSATSNGIAIPADLTDVGARQMYVFIVSQRDNLKNKDLYETFASQLEAKLDSKSEREFIRDNQSLALALLSQDKGVLFDPTDVPIGKLLKKPVEAGIKLYEKIVKNPKELGYKAPSDNDDKAENAGNPLIMRGGVIANKAKNMLAALLKRKVAIEKEGDRPEEESNSSQSAAAQKYVNPEKARTTSSSSGLMGGREEPDTVIGPRLTNEYLKSMGADERQLEIYNYIYDGGFVRMRSASMRVFADTLNDLKALTTEYDKDEWLESAGSRVNLWRPLDLPKAKSDTEQHIERAYHKTVFVDYLPKDAKEQHNQGLCANALQFYQHMYDNTKDFELKALARSQCKRIMGWLMSPASAPTIVESRMATSADPLLAAMGLTGKSGALALSMGAGAQSGGGMNPMVAAAMMGGMSGKGGKGGMNPMMAAAMMGGSSGGGNAGGIDTNTLMMMMMMQNQGGGSGSGSSEVNELRAELNKDKIEKLQKQIAALTAGGGEHRGHAGGASRPTDATTHEAPESRVKGKWVRKKGTNKKDVKRMQDLAKQTGVPYNWALQHDWVPIDEAFTKHGEIRYVLDPYWDSRQSGTFASSRKGRIRNEQQRMGTSLFKAVYGLEVPTGDYEFAANEPEEMADLLREHRIKKEKEILGDGLFETLYGQDVEANGEWDPVKTSWLELYKKQGHHTNKGIQSKWKGDAAKELNSYRYPALFAYARKMNEKHKLNVQEGSFRRLAKLWKLSGDGTTRRVLDPFWDPEHSGIIAPSRKRRIGEAREQLGDTLFEMVYSLDIAADEYAANAGDQLALNDLLRKYRVLKEKGVLGDRYEFWYRDESGGAPSAYDQWDPATKDWTDFVKKDYKKQYKNERNTALAAYIKDKNSLGSDQMGHLYKHFGITRDDIEEYEREEEREFAAPDVIDDVPFNRDRRNESSLRGSFKPASPSSSRDQGIMQYEEIDDADMDEHGGFTRARPYEERSSSSYRPERGYTDDRRSPDYKRTISKVD